MLAMQNEAAARSSLLERIADARRRSDALFNILNPSSLYDRPIPERHRIIFYIGHLEAFDWNLLHESLEKTSFHPEFDRLFSFGIDPVDGALPSDQPSDWPSAEKVRDYVSKIRSALDDKLDNGFLESHTEGRDGFSLGTLLNVAIEHRLMHVETLAYMLHQLPLERKVRPARSGILAASPPLPRVVEIPEGIATIGLARDSGTFGWDNEFEAHTVEVPRFEIDQYKVRNGEYLEFMNAGGYETQSLWTDEDWSWKESQKSSHPVFWRNTGSGWLLRTMFDEVALPHDWPVYVSHAEASAYARWAGKSLPTEEEWHRAAYGTKDGSERDYPWGDATPNSNLGNFDFNRWDPAPVNAFPRGQSAFGVHDMLGNGWEWTASKFAPFPGFEPFPFYPGYSANFFDGKHFVMKGGSPRTAACMLRSTFRNWFQAHYQYVYAGFRCVSH